MKPNQIKTWRDGCRISEPDSRDIRLGSVQKAIELNDLPEKYIIPYKLTVLNQDVQPACVGFSAAVLKSEKERREKIALDFDGLWLFKKCKAIDGIPDFKGTYLRVAMKVLKNFGAKPVDASETEAEKYKIGAYAIGDELTFDGIKKAIWQNGVVIAGFTGSDQGWVNAKIRPPKWNEVVWGHAVVLIGYDKDFIFGQNSWGENWGEKGLFYIPKDYLPFEFWVELCDLPSDFVIPEKPTYIFSKELQMGEKNDDIMALQKCLKYLGIFPVNIQPSGYFGQITFNSVQQFQKSKGLPQIGYVGKLTIAKLNEIFSSGKAEVKN